jgi:hypothetical protein
MSIVTKMIQKLRKLKGFCPLTLEEADAAYEAVPSDEISEKEVKSLVDTVTSKREVSDWWMEE